MGYKAPRDDRTYKWQREYLIKIHNMSNSELWREYQRVVVPDGEDGLHSPQGWWKFNESHNLMERRLGSWLTQEKDHEDGNSW